MTNTTVLADEVGRRPLKSVQSHLGQSASILGRAVLSVWHAFKSYHERRIAMAQLMALDDRMLKDIGIDRSEIHSMLVDTSWDRRRGNRPSLLD